ncbi:MAG: type II toxin-antitoxin system HicB family antitoxin [Sulfurimonas sp.]|uniref:type II toxin-antitoxin system HicB family antitoxin n=1 Tax=Sulfurimonas sp. TaxID=2022749 RepID=UPI0025E80766|nr:type II toxin-antitoxin system HicB family antitoxin [Sulfurimonas sp.]MCK9492458.1 type II toxin-antitoxin system HicB family antitoxin [Sulfurimonas sp.]
MKYIAFIYADEDEDGFNAMIPDLDGCFSCGDTFEEACVMIKEAGELYCEDLKKLPKASTLKELLDRNDLDIPQNAIPQLTNVKVEKLKRINVMMRTDIIDVLPERLVEFNGNRSAYLQNLVIQDLHSHKIATF